MPWEELELLKQECKQKGTVNFWLSNLSSWSLLKKRWETIAFDFAIEKKGHLKIKKILQEKGRECVPEQHMVSKINKAEH